MTHVRSDKPRAERSGQHWTQEETHTFLRRYHAGETDAQIALNLPGRTAKGIERVRQKMGLPAVGTAPPRIVPGHEKFREPAVRLEDAARSCRQHLVDLMREYGGGTLGHAKFVYRHRNELDLDPGYTNVTHSVSPYFPQMSFVGSVAAMCAG